MISSKDNAEGLSHFWKTNMRKMMYIDKRNFSDFETQAVLFTIPEFAATCISR